MTGRWSVPVRFVRQPTSATCVHACLSMVTGIPVADLIARFGDSELDFRQEATVLTENGIYPVPEPLCLGDRLKRPGVYFLTVPSLNHPGAAHRVVCRIGETARIIDPNRGNKGKKYYPAGAIFSRRRLCQYNEVVFLAPLPSHGGTAARLARFGGQRSEVRSQGSEAREVHPCPSV